MFRHIIPVCFLSIISAAPSEKVVGFDTKFGDSNIVYVKVHTLQDEDTPNIPYRESRIENIPFNKDFRQQNPFSYTENYSQRLTNIDLPSLRDNMKVNEELQRYNFDPYLDYNGELVEHGGREHDLHKIYTPDINTPINKKIVEHGGREHDLHKKYKPVTNTPLNKVINKEFNSNDRPVHKGNVLKQTAINVEDNENQDNQTRIARSEEEDDDITTQSYEGTTEIPSEEESEEDNRTEASKSTKEPRYISKLSYFEKSTPGSVIQNSVVGSYKRHFRSRCRCEKISNCPKLQISVPRCPDEQFLCCF